MKAMRSLRLTTAARTNFLLRIGLSVCALSVGAAAPLACNSANDESGTGGDPSGGDRPAYGDVVADTARTLTADDCPACPETCSDGELNAGEEDVDCGGSCISCDGLSLPPEGSPIAEHSAQFLMPVERNACTTVHRPAPQPMWSIFTAGRCAGCWIPSRMSSAAFDDTLIVSWVGSGEYPEEFAPGDGATEEEQADALTSMYKARYGHLSTFTFAPESGFSLISDVFFEQCDADMGSVAVSPDGQLIGALCLAHDDSRMGDYIDSAPEPRNPEEKRKELYLFEWTGGKVTDTPDKVVRLSRVSGGWNYGHWDLSLNADLTHYFVEEKATGGGHETELHYAVERDNDYQLLRGAWTDGANCGSGHTISNRITHNASDDSWAVFCGIDTKRTMRWHPVPEQDYVAKEDDEELGLKKDKRVKAVTIGHFENRGPIAKAAGGVANLISLGSRGWLATALGPLDLFDGADSNEEMDERLPYQQIGFRRLPLTIEEFVENEEAYPWHWVGLNDVCAPTKGKDRRAGMPQLHHWGTGGEQSGRYLLGYSPAMEHPGRSNEYHVVEVDEEGTFLHDPVLLQRGGWGVDSLGTYMPDSGCVVFPHTWLSDDSTTGPTEQYPKETLPVSERSLYLKFTALCPTGEAQTKTPGQCVTQRAPVVDSSPDAQPSFESECPSPYER